jgi:hypothetical protein
MCKADLLMCSEEEQRDTIAFYQGVLEALNSSAIPFLIGGAYAFNHYSEINRHTKDLDVFIRRRDFDRISEALLECGYETELTYPHWLGKIHHRGVHIDLIFSSGNGIAEVDDAWFEHASESQVLGVPARICPAEELIWSKAFIMERERYDGADVIHLLRTRCVRLDWDRLLARFDAHWRILLSHLVLFGFVYPADRDLVPVAVMNELLNRLRKEMYTAPPQDSICLGTLLSREQYLNDIDQQGLQDARITPLGNMSAQDAASWTRAIADDHEPSS